SSDLAGREGRRLPGPVRPSTPRERPGGPDPARIGAPRSFSVATSAMSELRAEVLALGVGRPAQLLLERLHALAQGGGLVARARRVDARRELPGVALPADRTVRGRFA